MVCRPLGRVLWVLLVGALAGYATVSEAAAPVLTSAVSRRTHTGVGDFDVTLPLTGSAAGSGIECRQLSGGIRIVMTFDQPVVASASPASTFAIVNDTTNSSAGLTLASPTFSGNTLTMTVSGMADATAYRVTATNVAAADASGTLASAVVWFRTLLADSTGNGQVTSADVAMVKSTLAQPVTLFNFRTDLTTNGQITSADVAQAKARILGSVAGGTITNTPPTIGTIPDQSATAGQATAPVGISVGDAETPAAALALKASSSDQGLLPNANITLGGSGASRTISVTASPNVTGTCQVTVTVTDGLTSTPTAFNVNITPAATLYIATLSPEHGHPSSGTGTATLQVNAAGTQAVLRFQYSNLTSPKVAEHLHHGAPGVDGPIIYDIDTPAPPSPPTQQADGSYLWIFDPNSTNPTPAQIISEIAAGNYYMNVHTANYTDGEIRGQFNLAQGSQTFTPPPYVAPPAQAPLALNDASRFLQQGTFGPALDDINSLTTSVSSTPLTDWINAQRALPATHIFGDGYGSILATTTTGSPTITVSGSLGNLAVGSGIIGPTGTNTTLIIPAGTVVTAISGSTVTLSQNALTTKSTATPLSYTPPTPVPWTYKARVCVEAASSESPDRVVENWWHNASVAPDQLRQRVAFAYSQIFVISSVDDNVSGQPAGMASWHDMLADDAFVNFRVLLNDVTLHPIMGQYLNMRGNVKQTLPAKPNENYAREIQQLFSIGLNLLQPDGTLKLDANGLPIPSYDQSVIEGFAQVFTGWNTVSSSTVPAGDVYNALITLTAPATGNALSQIKTVYHQPMVVTAGNHSVYEKDLLSYSGNYSASSPDRYIIPANASQTTISANSELSQALDNIFNHPNVGPFICRQLIQRLVGSTPSPAYVFRVAQVFANDQYNGSNPTDANGNPTPPVGVRGNMAAVIQAILLDSEARTTTMLGNLGYGHLREPLLRLSEGVRGTHATSNTGYFKIDTSTSGNLGQAAYRAPTVFNFYTPDYSDPGVVAAAGLASPELYIANENTNVIYVNTVYSGVYSASSWPGGDVFSRLDRLDPLQVLSADTTSASPTVSVSSANGLVAGEPVSGSGITSGTTILSINGNALTLSQNATATASGVSLTFGFVTATSNLSTTSASTSATVSSATGLVIGQTLVNNPNVVAGTYITNISGTTLTLSKAATATAASVSTTFGYGGNLAGIACEAVLAGNADVSTSSGSALVQLGLLDRLNAQFMGGAMPASMKTRIATYVNSLPTGSGANNLARARAAVNLVLSSAQFSTQK